MTAALLADIAEAKSLGVRLDQDQVNNLARRYGTVAPRVE
jgi:hypothetical protein